MKTIKYRGKTLRIDAITERAIEQIAHHGVVAVSDLGERRGSWSSYPRGIAQIPGVRAATRDYPSDRWPAKVRKFFANRPRVQFAYFDDRGRVARLYRKLQAA